MRKTVADKLYLFFLAFGDGLFGEDKNEEIIEILVGSNWNELTQNELKETKLKLEEISNLF